MPFLLPLRVPFNRVSLFLLLSESCNYLLFTIYYLLLLQQGVPLSPVERVHVTAFRKTVFYPPFWSAAPDGVGVLLVHLKGNAIVANLEWLSTLILSIFSILCFFAGISIAVLNLIISFHDHLVDCHRHRHRHRYRHRHRHSHREDEDDLSGQVGCSC